RHQLLLSTAETHSHQPARRKKSAAHPPARETLDLFEQQRRPFDVGSFTHAGGDLVLDIHWLGDSQELALTFQMGQITSQIFKHGMYLEIQFGVIEYWNDGIRSSDPKLKYSS